MENLEKKLEDQSLSSEEYSEEKVEESRLLQQEVAELESIVAEKGFDGLKDELLANANKWKEVEINIAVIGKSGSGKSSFINALLGIPQNDEKAALTGVTETTTSLKAYFHADYQNMKLWDMPGVGTPKHPKETYLKDVKFFTYDFFLILSKGRFADDEKWLAEEIQRTKRKFYFIRTGVDMDVSNDMRVNRKQHDAMKVQETIRKDIYSNLEDAHIKNPEVFLVDSLSPDTYEFGDLVEQLLDDCEWFKRDALVLSLSNLTKKVFLEKKRVLKKRSLRVAVAIACECRHRMEQKRFFRDEVNFLGEQFNLLPETVCKNKDILELSEKNLSEIRDSWEENAVSKAQNIPRTNNFTSMFFRSVQQLFKKKGDTDVDYILRVVRFCSDAFDDIIDALYETALYIYDERSHQVLVQNLVYDEL